MVNPGCTPSSVFLHLCYPRRSGGQVISAWLLRFTIPQGRTISSAPVPPSCTDLTVLSESPRV